MTNNRLFIGWREAELRAKLDGSYDKQDDLRHERDALRAENERLTKQTEYDHKMINLYSAEIDRLRAALAKHHQHNTSGHCDYCGDL